MLSDWRGVAQGTCSPGTDVVIDRFHGTAAGALDQSGSGALRGGCSWPSHPESHRDPQAPEEQRLPSWAVRSLAGP